MGCSTQRPALEGCEPELVVCIVTGVGISVLLADAQVGPNLQHPQKGHAGKGECTQETECTCNSVCALYMSVCDKNISGLVIQGC